jgi:hypothetical protein
MARTATAVRHDLQPAPEPRIDVLDRERRRGRITEASYLVGRQVEQVFKHMHAMGERFELDRTDGSRSIELKAVAGSERLVAVNNFLRWLMHHVGQFDTWLLWIVLGNRVSFELARVALWPHQRGVRGLHYTIDRFRDALAMLAEAKAAKGSGIKNPARSAAPSEPCRKEEPRLRKKF